jgi:CRISPR/Cas system-associated endonuclease Cas3-HD
MATQNKDIVENIYEEYVKRMNLIKSDFRQETFKNILNQYLVIDRKVVDDLMKDILYMKA